MKLLSPFQRLKVFPTTDDYEVRGSTSVSESHAFYQGQYTQGLSGTLEFADATDT